MINELQRNEFYKCKSLILEHGHLEIRAIVEGNNPGRIFVDDLKSPRTGLIWFGNLDGFAFIGDSANTEFNEHINHLFDEVIIPEAIQLGLKWFEGFGDAPAWNTTIEQVFASRQLDASNQKVYSLNKHSYNPSQEPVIDPRYEVMRITEEMMNPSYFSNQDFLLNKILEFWDSTDHFIHKGIGYCAIDNDEIVSLCFSGFVAGQIHGLGIETLKEHRGNKLAQAIAHALVQECVANDLVPYWDCMDVNAPSKSVAEKIGLTNIFDYTVYEFPF
ncbi:GNAT family N-acetyltransferase [Paenibacillus albiflavus]|uniref:GNAT family N-acetyltransferase n=1 Tax=Paenibacillus albiflavus TaxID=2545760 RepID=A0A4R4EM41_9BACL|nr:GNAT family N-acetyltransferase [Paenibacillus albiflavus]TCZ81119.1 GNAT family N-acetyltransferase [Paenibacillus albiflavus]